MKRSVLLLAMAGAFLSEAISCHADFAMTNFFNFENNPVHPVALSPDSTRLAVCNLPDDRLEILDVTSGVPVSLGSVTVGLEPVTVRFRTATEMWVVNHVSSSISIVDLPSMRVTATLSVSNEPADVVFAGTPPLAFISCERFRLVQVVNPTNLLTVTSIVIEGKRPRAMAVSPDGSTVYAAIFQSGNAATIISAGIGPLLSLPNANPVTFPDTPYGGVDPPPNSGTNFVPALNPALSNTPAPVTGMIVKKNSAGQWMDDNQGDWTEFISGTNAALTGRLPGWDLPDHDLAVINAATFSVHYATGLMNLCMALGVNPATGQIAVAGTDAINQIRFQPVLDGIFVRVELALVDPLALTNQVLDLNPQLNYQTPVVAESLREFSLGDPRALLWSSNGSRGYITGMGSGNLIIIDAQGDRVGTNPPIDLGQGPTGMALDEGRSRLYVYNRFDDSISTVDITNQVVTATLPFLDPTPTLIKTGRPFLYDTHLTSGLGQASCASCHVDGRTDGLAWDLGDPTSTIQVIDSTYNFANPLPAVTNNYHPMKGPMTTVTLQDIIGHEPFHWRGDRTGIEQFNIGFTNLLAMPDGLDTNEMQELKSFLGTIGFGPNPFRPLDNSLPTNLALPGQFALGRGVLAAGAPLPNGNASNGLFTFGDEQNTDACILCHTLPTGLGTDMHFVSNHWEQIPPDTNSNHHLALVAIPRSDNLPFKIPQLRNLFDKTGMDLFHTNSGSGFGFSHDGSVDSVVRFVQDSFQLTNDQQTADLVAFLFSLTGSDLPNGSLTDPDNAPGVASQDTPAATGLQTTLSNSAPEPWLDTMLALAANPVSQLDLVLKGRENGLPRGWFFERASGFFQSDRLAETETPGQLLALAAPGSEQTYMLVPAGSGERIGIERDADGYFDQDELDAGSNPANPPSIPSQPPPQIGGISLALSTNGVALNLFAVPGLACQLQYKNSLADPAWTTLSTNTAVVGPFSVSDLTRPTNAARFYRIIAGP
jgi:DNA-binding beta-propeller fold protein YncE